MIFCQLKPWLGHPCAGCSNLVGSPGGTEKQILAIGDQLHPGVPGGMCAVAVLVNVAASSGYTGVPHTCSLQPGQGFVLQNRLRFLFFLHMSADIVGHG